MQRNFLWIFSGPEDTVWKKEPAERQPRGLTTHQGAPWAPGAPLWVVAHLLTSRTASSSYKFLKIPKTLTEDLDRKFRRRKLL